MAYSDEALDGFNEMVAEFGTSVVFQGRAAVYDAMLVFPTAGDQTRDAGSQPTAMSGVEIRRADFVAAGVNQNSRFTVAGRTQILQVDAIEDDPGQPIVFLQASEVE